MNLGNSSWTQSNKRRCNNLRYVFENGLLVQPSHQGETVLNFISLFNKNYEMYLKKKIVQARELNFNNQKCHLKGFQSLKKVHGKEKVDNQDSRWNCVPNSSVSICKTFVVFSCSVVFNSLWSYGLQHARPSWLSPSPRVCSNSCPLSQWYHPTILAFVIPFSSCLQLTYILWTSWSISKDSTVVSLTSIVIVWQDYFLM